MTLGEKEVFMYILLYHKYFNILVDAFQYNLSLLYSHAVYFMYLKHFGLYDRKIENCCPKPCLRGTFSYRWGWCPERVRLPNLSSARGPDPQTIPDQLLPSTSLQPDRFLFLVGLHLHDPRKQQVFMDRKFSNGCLSKY